jgi:hypothetical protein
LISQLPWPEQELSQAALAEASRVSARIERYIVLFMQGFHFRPEIQKSVSRAKVQNLMKPPGKLDNSFVAVAGAN